MPRPGVDVTVEGDPTYVGADLDSSQGFYAGVTERGRAGGAPCRSFNDYKARYGGRTAATQDMYDAARAFFEEGGTILFVAPMYGAGAVESTGNLGTMLALKAKGGGTWGNSVKVSTIADTGLGASTDAVLQIENPAGTVVETSYPLDKVSDAVSWVNTYSNYVTATAGSGGADADMTQPATITLSAGVAGGAIVPGDVATALGGFPYELGPGQMYMPGRSSIQDLTELSKAILATTRVGIWDLPDTNDPTVIATSMNSVSTMEGAGRMLGVGPKLAYPHETAPSMIYVPPGGVEAGIIARVDKLQDRSLVAAGSDGISRRALGLKQLYEDDDREDLNNLGAALYKVVDQQVRMYGYRTSAGPGEKNWMFFQESRVIMQLAHDLDAIMEEYVLKTIDGRKILQNKVNIALTGKCIEYWNANALYGEAASDAFRVDTDSVNNINTAMAGEIHALVKVKTSRVAEWININLVKTMLDRPF
jgi:hypothetical protein